MAAPVEPLRYSTTSKTIGRVQTVPSSTEAAIPPDLLTLLHKAINDISSHLRADSLLPSSIFYRAMLFTVSVLQANFQTLSTQSSQLSQFPGFSKLPLEPRLMIWRFAGGRGQIIGLKPLPKPSQYGLINFTETDVRCPLLLVCKEARQEALKSKIDLAPCIYQGEPYIYINCEVDTPWLLPATEDLGYGDIPFP